MSSAELDYTKAELLAVMTARLLEDGKTIFVGIGLPMVAALLAQLTHSPRLCIIFEGGIIAPELKRGKMPLSTNEIRAARRAMAFCSITDMFLYQQRGFIDYGLLGAAQIDKYGNINTSVIGDYTKPKVRLPGSGGANDIASAATRVIISVMHEKRRFVERLDFRTSPGFIEGGDSRIRSGLIFGGPYKVITDLGIFGFNKTSKHLTLEAIHKGISPKQVAENTGFKLPIAEEVEETKPPTQEELRVLREIDPDKVMLRGG
ncbi:MAG TPA: CoA-transferase [Candidatus Bathyarchaeia archaeon]|nr:CoA-transferase [Candidatus Bathyarchaeia archaeon]